MEIIIIRERQLVFHSHHDVGGFILSVPVQNSAELQQTISSLLELI